MSDILLSWLCLEALLAFHSWMQAPSEKPALWFAVWAILALLTKITALTLALLPAFAILLTRRWSLLRERSLWVAGATVTLFTAPWYLFVPGARHEAVSAYVGVPGLQSGQAMSLLARLAKFSEDLPAVAAWLGPLLLLALWGMWRDRKSLVLPGLIVGSWVASVLAFRFIVISASYEERTLAPLLAPLMIAAASAAARIASAIPLRTLSAGAAAVAVFATMGVARIPSKGDSGVEDLARYVCQRPEFRNAVILVVSDTFREGAFIAEMALGEQRPGHYVLRATKVMAESNWNGRGYKLLTKTPDEVVEMLDRIPVGLIVYDRKPRRTPEHQILMGETLAGQSARLRPVPIPADIRPGTFELYLVSGNENRALSNLSIRSLGLGRRIEKQ